MPTVVDSLVIQLGFDARALNQAARQATAGLQAIKKSAGETGDTLKKTEDQGRRTAQQMSSQGNVAAEYFNKIRNQALSLMAVLIGGKGIGETIQGVVTNLASLGRQATMLGSSVPQLAAYRNMIAEMGGSADEAGASLQRMQNAIDDLKTIGSSPMDPFFAAIGGVPSDANDALIRFARFAEQHRNQPAEVRRVGRLGGYSPAEVIEAMKGEAQVRRDLADAQKRATGSTKEGTEQMQAVQTAWVKLTNAAQNLANILIVRFGPAFTAILDAVTKFIEDHPYIATAIGVAGAGGTVALGIFGFLKSFLGGAALTASAAALTGSSVALDASAAALMGAAGALGAGGLAGAAGGVAGRAGRFATSTGAGAAASRLGTALRWAGPIGAFVAGMWPGSTASDDTTQEPNMGGVRGGDPKTLGMTDEQYDIYRATLGKRESGGRYGIVNRYGYAGKYQFGGPEIRETALALGETPPTREQFLANPEMQERYMLQYTLAHHQQLMRDPVYAAMTPEQRAGALATAHLKGVGGALRQLHGGSAGVDANNTSGASYNQMMLDAYRRHAAMAAQAQDGTAGRQQVSNDNSRSQTVNVHGPITVQTAATDARGLARGLRSEFAGGLVGAANTGLA